jgi:hypothetical protein
MSGSDPPSGADSASVELSARIPSIELSVVGSDFRPVAVGMGRLSARVPPGIYQVVARAGPVVDRTLISLEPGATYRNDDLFVGFPAAAPVQGTTTSHEYHQYLAQQASVAVGQSAGPPCGLLLVVRDVRGMEGPPLTDADLACFVLLDQSLNALPGFEQGWRLQEGAAIATWGSRMLAGGYALRTDPSRLGGDARRPSGRQAYDMSVWLSPGWQTVVFITTGPAGPQASAASVHMAPVDQGWSPFEADVGLALELANWGLREGRSAVPDDLLGALLNTKFVNPMLGIVGAHSLFLRRQPDPKLLRVVMDNLEAMVPGHPDVLALRWLFAARQAQETGAGPWPADGQRPPGGVTWPPMLLPSYRALVAMDAFDPGVIVDGSPAERAAANLLVQGTWTNWAPLSPAPPAGPPRDPAGPQAVGVLPLLGRDPRRIEQLPLDDPATARVAAYLSALAALEGPAGREQRFATLSPQEIGLATTLPSATVDRTLARWDASLGPPQRRRQRNDGPTPPGPLSGLLPLLLLGAVLFGGALGVAWCAGSEECPIPIGRSDSTPTASLQPQTPPPETTAPQTPAPQTPAPPTEAPVTRPPVTDAPATDAPVTDTATPVVLSHDAELPRWPLMLGASESREFRVTSSGEGVVRFAIDDRAAGAFSVVPECEPVEIEPGVYGCAALLTFAPLREGPFETTMTVSADGAPEPGTVRLSGEGLPLVLEHEDRIVFDEVDLPSQGSPPPPRIVRFSVDATEQVELLFRVVENQANFFSADRSCTWESVDEEQFRCQIEVRFQPTDDGPYSAVLEIVTAEPAARRVPMSGRANNPVD